MKFSNNLQYLMQKNQTSAYKLAKSIGVHTSTVTGWCKGKSPTFKHLKLVADFFGVSIDTITCSDIPE